VKDRKSRLNLEGCLRPKTATTATEATRAAAPALIESPFSPISKSSSTTIAPTVP
jgi:hypothetical protein